MPCSPGMSDQNETGNLGINEDYFAPYFLQMI